MAYDKHFYSLLRSDRDDQAKAQAFDEWYDELAPQEQKICDHALLGLMQRLTLNQAKALFMNTVFLVNAKPDEREWFIEHGEYLRAQFEWGEARRA